MLKKFFFFSIIVIACNISKGQGIVRGKITDENGEPVTGATIYLKSQTNIGTISDFNGLYSLKIPGSGEQVLHISLISYKIIEDTINPQKGEILIKDYNLVPVSNILQDVVVVGKANKARDIYMEKLKAKSSTTIDYISSETIRKIGDTNVASAIARVTGVSTTNNFITVRGIGDRYIKTTLNGSRIPTLDPFTNNIKLDLFPSTLIDNIVLMKTASPDLPGDWAGAYISIETKDYPEKLAVNVETSFGYNQQTSFEDIPLSQRSSTDWIGYDNGLRDIDHNRFINVVLKPGVGDPPGYYEFAALGLSDVFNLMSVNASNYGGNATTYELLGYEKLGLLGEKQFNDPEAIAKAKALYLENFRERAVVQMNLEAVKRQNELLPDNWHANIYKAPINLSQNFSIGNQTTLFGKSLGYLLGFRYYKSEQYDPNGNGYYFRGMINEEIGLNYDTLQQPTAKETNGWSALANIALKLNRNNSVSFMFMPNVIGVNKARNGYVYNLYQLQIPRRELVDQFYESRKQMVYQVKSEHFIPGPKAKIEWNASYTNGESDIPDFKVLYSSSSASEHRYFRYLKENVFDTRITAEFPLVKSEKSMSLKLKTGAAYQYADRRFDQYHYIYMENDFTRRDVDSLINNYYLKNIDVNSGSNDVAYHFYGNSKIIAGFLMVDYILSPSIRFSGGLRIEKSNMISDAETFHKYGLSRDDGRRIINTYKVLPANREDVSYLPSGNFVYKIKKSETAPINLRLNYSQSIARPSLREISDLTFYDFELRENTSGNPDLKIVKIKNYDLRLETYFKNGDNLSLSVFYKDFQNHIEFLNFKGGDLGIGYKWNNSGFNGWIKGIEIEGKKSITKQLEFRANLTLANSFSKINTSWVDKNGTYNQGQDIEYTMLGQAPYVINGMLGYNSEKLGINAALSYNLQGPRLVILSIIDTYPDIYEMPRDVLDFRISKTIGKHFGISFKAQDILNSPVKRSYKFRGKELPTGKTGYLLDYDKYRWGTNYTLSVSYKI